MLTFIYYVNCCTYNFILSISAGIRKLMDVGYVMIYARYGWIYCYRRSSYVLCLQSYVFKFVTRQEWRESRNVVWMVLSPVCKTCHPMWEFKFFCKRVSDLFGRCIQVVNTTKKITVAHGELYACEYEISVYFIDVLLITLLRVTPIRPTSF